jgi:hypothetical protein
VTPGGCSWHENAASVHISHVRVIKAVASVYPRNGDPRASASGESLLPTSNAGQMTESSAILATSSPPHSLTPTLPHSHRSIARSNVRRASPPSRASVVARAYKVNLKDIDGKVTTLEVRVDAGGLRGCKLALTRLLRAHAQVGEDQNILEVALESGIENLPHDCKLVRTP